MIKSPGKIPLGSKVKCIVSGFTGIATSCTVYLNNCIRYGVTASSSKPIGKVMVEYFDEEQLKVIGTGVTNAVKGTTQTGGDRDAPKYYTSPIR